MPRGSLKKKIKKLPGVVWRMLLDLTYPEIFVFPPVLLGLGELLFMTSVELYC